MCLGPGRHHRRKKAHERGAVGAPTAAAPGLAGRRGPARRTDHARRAPCAADAAPRRRSATAADRPGADDDDVDRLLLAFEELVSNGLRHGGGPVQRGRDHRRLRVAAGGQRRGGGRAAGPGRRPGCRPRRTGPVPGRAALRRPRLDRRGRRPQGRVGPRGLHRRGSPVAPSRSTPAAGPGPQPPVASPSAPGAERSRNVAARAGTDRASLVPDRTPPAQRRRRRRRPVVTLGLAWLASAVNASNNERLLAQQVDQVATLLEHPGGGDPDADGRCRPGGRRRRTVGPARSRTSPTATVGRSGMSLSLWRVDRGPGRAAGPARPRAAAAGRRPDVVPRRPAADRSAGGRRHPRGTPSPGWPTP